MTAASTGSTAAESPGAGPRPQFLTLAAILLAVTAVLGVLLPLTSFTDSTYVGCSRAVTSANASPTGSPSATASGSGGASASPSASSSLRATTQAQLNAQLKSCYTGTSGALRPTDDAITGKDVLGSLIGGFLPLVVLGALAFFVYRGAPVVRWFVVGIWVISNAYPLVPFGVLPGLGAVASPAIPVTSKIVLVLGAVTFTVAAVLVNLRPSTTYFNARRPIRAAGGVGAAGGGGLGSLFRPRPPAGRTTGTTPAPRVSTTKAPPSAGTTPASTRPTKSKGSGGSGNTGRAKGKRRG